MCKLAQYLLLRIPQLKINQINMDVTCMSTAVDNHVASRYACGPICSVCINLSSREDTTPSHYNLFAMKCISSDHKKNLSKLINEHISANYKIYYSGTCCVWPNLYTVCIILWSCEDTTPMPSSYKCIS